ncbi:MAG: toxin YoeB [Legionellales bacterium RIFCSPHIGHO2_12_FULL_37_14]|nr:MAG: toxin YoeB [Legionellales bacterium RIFCSPHIGHO2_12_FULL_37_14]
MSKLSWHLDAWEDYLFWQKNDKKILQKTNELIKAIIRDPFSGIGKPESLKHALDGYWSRRITQEHRLVYKVTEDGVHIVQCRYHY